MSDLRKQLRQANKASIKHARDMNAWGERRQAFISSYGQQHVQALRNIAIALNMDVNVHVSATSAAIQNWEMQNPAPVKPSSFRRTFHEYVEERMEIGKWNKFGEMTRRELNRIGSGKTYYGRKTTQDEVDGAKAELQRRAWYLRDLWEARRQAVLDAPYNEI